MLASALLIERGPAIVPDLSASLPDLADAGRVLAVEVFTALGDRRAGPGLTRLLDYDDGIAREWAAEHRPACPLVIQSTLPYLREDCDASPLCITDHARSPILRGHDCLRE
jgi:hypothetical protein